MWLAAFAGIVTDSAQKETGPAGRSGNLVPARTGRSTAGAAGGFCAGAEPAETAAHATVAPMIAKRISTLRLHQNGFADHLAFDEIYILCLLRVSGPRVKGVNCHSGKRSAASDPLKMGNRV